MSEVEFILQNGKSSIIDLAYMNLLQLYKKYDRVLVLGSETVLLEQLDERLWQNSHDKFVPYSMDTESYQSTATVLLSTNAIPSSGYNALLNIGATIPTNSNRFRAIIEIVADDEEQKEQARERYKLYRRSGFNVTMGESSET